MHQSNTLDKEVLQLAQHMVELGEGYSVSVFRMSPWIDGMLDRAMRHPAFKAALFHFVDVYPSLPDDEALFNHLDAYLADHLAKVGATVGSTPADTDLELTDSLRPLVARENIDRLAQQFIVGSELGDSVDALRRLWDDGTTYTLDFLGERTLRELEADRYGARVLEMLAGLARQCAGWPPNQVLEHDDRDPLPRVNVSVKPTALASLYTPLTWDEGIAQARLRLRTILTEAIRVQASIHLDMEHYAVKDMTLALFKELLDDPELDRAEVGITIQAYLKDSLSDLTDVVAWSARRHRPVTVRLVKGAYWDSEVIEARAAGWPIPVFESKAETDASYERCIRLLHDHHGEVRAAFASHSLRSLAYAVCSARERGIPDNGYEVQMLYGMAEPIQVAVRKLGLRLRLYAPVGELVAGMGYLVRRLLENTSSDSFLRQHFVGGKPLAEAVASPYDGELPGAEDLARRSRTDPTSPSAYSPEPPLEWHRRSVRESFQAAVEAMESRLGEGPIEVPAMIDGTPHRTATTIVSVDPAEPDRVVALSASSGVEEAEMAVAAALRSYENWAGLPARDRAGVLFGAAHWMRSRREELSALEVFEAGKPWKEADADVCEAIDFCEYYGREALRLAAGGLVQSPPGEWNRLVYQARGVGVVISPWNFPLAIPIGMVAAALVMGNAVILKPAEQTPAVAAQIVKAFEEGGVPPGVLAFLPGLGEVVGDLLVRHPAVSFIVFTGSKDVGLQINAAAATVTAGQSHVKKVVAEMGGKNALVIDQDADLDQAIPAVVASAYGFSGQKCSAASRVVVVGLLYDEVVDRLAGVTSELIIGHPRRMSTQLGPLIDAVAQERVRQYARRAPDEGRVVLAREDVPEVGFFVGPVIVADLSPDASLVKDEIFGPVLTIQRARDFEEAITIANDTGYALTAGVFSRTPANIARAHDKLRAGNVYINRGMTGAVVGRQPFGGYGLSGVGSKAGGQDYLLQFVNPRTLTENTVRQGFASPVVGTP